MQFNIPILVSLFAASTTASRLSFTPSSSPASSSATPSSIATPSSSSIATPSSSASATPSLNPDDYDCIYQGRGCDWRVLDYTYGSDYCGYSPYEPGQTLSDGSIVVAVAQNGTSEACTEHASHACCKALDEDPCRRGEKYLECYKD